ncbi:MAG TPA: LamG domain-containing protein [Thermomonas sp.]|nr:LamG domain-containing protein [Thermomonas sp.]
MSRVLVPRRDLILPSRFRQRQGGFIMTPHAHGGTPATDPHWANVVLLAHGNGANNGTVFTEERGKVLTPTGTVVTSTTSPKFGSAALLFPNGSNAYLSTPSSTDFDFGTGDFVIEFWIRTAHTGSYATLLCREWGGSPYTGGWSFMLNGNAGAPMQIWVAAYSTGGPMLTASGTGYRDGNWHHVAWERVGNVFTLYIDGVADATVTSSISFATVSKAITIGADLTFGSRYYAGYMDDLRITKGVSRYNGTFTPPTAQFPDS